MFKLDESHNYLWPVKVKTPIDGGKYRTDAIQVRFRTVSEDRIEELRRQRRDGMAQGEEKELLDEVIVGWEDIGDESGQPLPFNPENLRKLLALPYVRVAVMEGFIESISGGAYKAKN